MTLNDFIKKLECLRSTNGGDINVVVIDNDTGWAMSVNGASFSEPTNEPHMVLKETSIVVDHESYSDLKQNI
jgi:hypothetical protein